MQEWFRENHVHIRITARDACGLEGVQGLYINERLRGALVLLTDGALVLLTDGALVLLKDGALVLVGRCRFTY